MNVIPPSIVLSRIKYIYLLRGSWYINTCNIMINTDWVVWLDLSSKSIDEIWTSVNYIAFNRYCFNVINRLSYFVLYYCISIYFQVHAHSWFYSQIAITVMKDAIPGRTIVLAFLVFQVSINMFRCRAA